jgi:hypothetical protein
LLLLVLRKSNTWLLAVVVQAAEIFLVRHQQVGVEVEQVVLGLLRASL